MDLRQSLILFFGKMSKNSSYYQGFNDILGFLQSQFGFAQALIFTEGLQKQYLYDFTNLPFSDCLIPVFKAVTLVIKWKQPDWDKDKMLFTAVQSKFIFYMVLTTS